MGISLVPVLSFGISRPSRTIKITERFSFQFRAEFFNAFNHTNFAAVDPNIDSSSAGQVTSAHDPRQIQLGGKLYF